MIAVKKIPLLTKNNIGHCALQAFKELLHTGKIRKVNPVSLLDFGVLYPRNQN